MAAFYEMALNLKPIAGTRSDTNLTLVEKICLARHKSSIAASIDILPLPKAREDTPVNLRFEVEDIDSECYRLESSGAIVLPSRWGTCNVLDPEGNVFEIHSSN